MLFHMQDAPGDAIIGWVLPNNPSATPKIKIFGSDGLITELEPNVSQLDLRDGGFHETGRVGFRIDEKTLPGLRKIHDQIQIRESESGLLLYRKFLPESHVKMKLFRFELQAMPDTKTEELIAKRFSLSYGAVQRHPQDTLFAILNNPSAQSIYLAGCPSFQQYEQLLREREYKIVALIRNPLEEMAERLLFARYAASADVPAFVADYMFGLEPLKEMAMNIKLDDFESVKAAFRSMSEPQKEVLSNPLVRTLACSANERPKAQHIHLALAKLARMDLVGLRNRFDEFKAMLPEVVGLDIFAGHELTKISWVERFVTALSEIKQVKSLIALDLGLYAMVEQAVTEALQSVSAAS
jgi:hypothetical protein